jgi:hypothetical protein
MSTLKVTSVQHASAASAAITLASDGTAAATLSSVNGGPLSGTRNRIINGDMRIDQRNAGASVTVNNTSPPFYGVDRFEALADPGNGVYTVQRSSTAPTGFNNSLLATITTSSTSNGQYNIAQKIEGFNTAGLNFGTANASSVTLSFWVRSSLTGTFAGGLSNSAGDRSYVFTYSISAANKWEQKSVTNPGDTTGTWLSDNGIGIRVIFNLGSGTGQQAAAGSWTGSYAYATSGAVRLISTLNATFYITGVQLEAGTVATPFERRNFGQELQLCLRYYERLVPNWYGNGYAYNSNQSESVLRVDHLDFPLPPQTFLLMRQLINQFLPTKLGFLSLAALPLGLMMEAPHTLKSPLSCNP